jgi:hypothetical protein
MLSTTRIKRALGAAALVAPSFAVAAVGGTAAPFAASADEEPATETSSDLGVEPHGDPIEAGEAWSQAGSLLDLKVPVALENLPCTVFRASDDTANETLAGKTKWHVVVAVPRDVWTTDNYKNAGRDALYAQAVQTVATIENFYKVRVGMGDVGQTPNQWTQRFDYGTACGAQFPDVSVYHLPKSQAGYTTQPFSGLVADLDASNLYERANKRYLVHYAGKSIYCGQSYIYAPTDNTGGAKYSITYNLHTLALTGAADVPCDWTTSAHEMGHSIGAATGGPQNLDRAHTWDCYNDVMSYADVTAVCGDGALYFDYKENNYFGHSGSWNDTDRSAFWCKPTC